MRYMLAALLILAAACSADTPSGSGESDTVAGTSAAEVVRLEIERIIIDLNLKETLWVKAPESFAGIWFEPSRPELYVAFANDTEVWEQRLAEDYSELAGVLTVVQADFTLTDLASTSERIGRAVAGGDAELALLEGASYDTFVDEPRNRVVVRSSDPGLGPVFGAAFPNGIVVFEIGATTTTRND